MAAMDDDERPKKKITHEIGQDLALISVRELEERIALLREEIERLEADIRKKQSSRNVADQFFKKWRTPSHSAFRSARPLSVPDCQEADMPTTTFCSCLTAD